jgi:tRNA(Ile)-lysidine synthase
LRNKVRHDVIPVLKELQPNLLSSFQNTLDNLQQTQSLVHDASRLIYKDVVIEVDGQIKINLLKLLQLPNYKSYLFQWLKDYNFTAWNDIYNLVNAQSGKQIFSENYTLLKDRDFLLVYETENINHEIEYKIEDVEQDVKVPLNLSICRVDSISDCQSNVIFVDENKLRFPLIIRKKKDGDYFYPFGMQGKKNLSKFFKDEKLSLIDKSDQWVLCSDNEIVWLINKRFDDRFNVTEDTTNILKITTL